jgi:SAM-dependent methyltransferase
MARAGRDVRADRPLHARGPAAARSFVCDLCEGTDGRALFAEPVPGQGLRSLVQCQGCSLVRLHPLPAPSEIPAFYGSDYYGELNQKFGPLTELFILLFRLARVRALHALGVKGGKVLDVGCGRGQFLRLLSRLGYDVRGTELSADSAAAAQCHLGDRVRAGSLNSCAFADEEFDAVTAWQVFEHLHGARETLRECRRILKPGGALVLSMPNIDSWQHRWASSEWFHLDLPRHLYHYSPVTLRRLLESEGFVLSRVSHFSVEQNPFGFLQSALNRLGARRSGLYQMLRGPRDRGRRDRWRRLPAYLAYIAAFPIAAVVESIWSLLGAGATFTALARKREATDQSV